MVQLLLDQNTNLKQQNKYLHLKLKEISGKEKELVETVFEYESIMSALNVQNEQLQKEILYFSQKANGRVDRLGKKLGKLLGKGKQKEGRDRDRDRQRQKQKQQMKHIRHQRDRQQLSQPSLSHPSPTQKSPSHSPSPHYSPPYFQLPPSPNYLHPPPINPFKRIKSQQRMHNVGGMSRGIDYSSVMINGGRVGNGDVVEGVSGEFEALLYACRMEVNPEKRKELRRRLVEITYKKSPTGY